MYKVIHEDCKETFEEKINEAGEEGFVLDFAEFHEGAEDYHFIAIMVKPEGE